MSARNKASQRDFNRRRNILLTKAFDMVFYQKGTNLSKCLLRQNPREIEDSKAKLERLVRRERSASSNTYVNEKLFIENRWKTSIEPSILMQRPSTVNSTNYNLNIPRYRRPTTATMTEQPVIDTLLLARPCMKYKFNTWESSDSIKKEPSLKEKSVHFEPAIPRGGVISKTDQKDLFQYWYNRRVSSARDDATRHSMLKVRAASANRTNNIQSTFSRSVTSPCNNIEISRPRSVSSIFPGGPENIFITQLDPMKLS